MPNSPAVTSALQIAANTPRQNIANNVTGGLDAPIPGRTDHLPISVPDGAYIIPADVVSALGEGNTAAGTKILHGLLGDNGPQPGGGKPVDIAAAGGEYVVSPQAVANIGSGNQKKGHDILDALVNSIRKKNIKNLSALKGPNK